MKYALVSCDRISQPHIAAAKADNPEFATICDIAQVSIDNKSEIEK